MQIFVDWVMPKHPYPFTEAAGPMQTKVDATAEHYSSHEVRCISCQAHGAYNVATAVVNIGQPHRHLESCRLMSIRCTLFQASAKWPAVSNRRALVLSFM